MKVILSICCLSFLFVGIVQQAQLAAQNAVTRQNPLLVGNHPTAVFFVREMLGWVLCDDDYFVNGTQTNGYSNTDLVYVENVYNLKVKNEFMCQVKIDNSAIDLAAMRAFTGNGTVVSETVHSVYSDGREA